MIAILQTIALPTELPRREHQVYRSCQGIRKTSAATRTTDDTLGRWLNHPRFSATGSGWRSLDTREVADHEDYVYEPKREPRRPDDKEPDREKDQRRSQEQQRVSEQPEAIASTRVHRPIGIGDAVAKRGAVVIVGREHEGERRHSHHDHRCLKQNGVD